MVISTLQERMHKVHLQILLAVLELRQRARLQYLATHHLTIGGNDFIVVTHNNFTASVELYQLWPSPRLTIKALSAYESLVKNLQNGINQEIHAISLE